MRLRALSEIPTYLRQFTLAQTSQNTRDYPFDCALSGPFDNLFLTRLSAPRALCEGITAVISASSVYHFKLYTLLHFAIVLSIIFLKERERLFSFPFWCSNNSELLDIIRFPHGGGRNASESCVVRDDVACAFEFGAEVIKIIF